ncbi:MAG: hypothetical protein GZ090_01560 [Oxalobacteraceae bacterium]|nr:hypothetical protein [Oxalobacteraceae bacterium]
MKFPPFRPVFITRLIRISPAAPNPVIAEMRIGLRRIGIAWQLWRMQVQQRSARHELIHVVLEKKRVVDNYTALLSSNAARTAALHRQLKTLMEDGQ